MAVIKTNGGYNALPISYKRGNPIPLDKSSVWYDYEALVAYATTDPTAYVGQILSLVDVNNVNDAKAYIILNLAGDIEEIGTGAVSGTVDSLVLQLEQVAEDIDNIENSITNLMSVVGVPGDQDVEASGLYAELNKKANAQDVYTKEETDFNIGEAVSKAAHLKRKEVDSIDNIDPNASDADQYIYMVPSGLLDDDNKYYEYIVIEVDVKDEDGIVIGTEKRVERVGSWAVDLSGYAKLTDVAQEKSRAEAAESALDTKITNLQTSVDTIGSNLETLTEDVSNLTTVVDNKVTKTYYTVENEDGSTTQVEGTLLNPEEKAKLAALSIDEDGDIGISGTISVENVQGLSTWITDNSATYVQNLTEDNLSQEIVNKLNYITAVDGSNFTVTNGTLYLNELSTDKITGLNTLITTVGNLEAELHHEVTGLSAVNTKLSNLEQGVAKCVTLETFNTTVGDLNSLLNTHTQQINEIKSQLTWQELTL